MMGGPHRRGYNGNLTSSTTKKQMGRTRERGEVVGEVAVFLIKVAALETVRRVSRSTKCPCVWRGIQALQFLCIPPFKSIQRWAPLKGLVKAVQMFSRPLLFLSVATAFSDQSDVDVETSAGFDGSLTNLEPNPESPCNDTLVDSRNIVEVPQRPTSENWLLQLYKELDSQGITLPDRINEDELHRFYNAANQDFSTFLLSVKKTIRWRETYKLLSEKELEMWSDMVFWHGFDIEHRPCLVVRLGFAYINLPSCKRPRLAQAVVSQIEHGVLNLVDKDKPHVTVLLDCDGITPLRIPMQMVRSCSSLLQENYPDRLGYLLVIRLPPVFRVITQTLFQVLKPMTRKKLRIQGNMYHRFLSEYLQSLPSYLGGNCTCKICSNINTSVLHRRSHSANEMNKIAPNGYHSICEDLPLPQLAHSSDIPINDNWDHMLRTAVIGLLMVWVFIALVAGLYDPETRLF